jgi:hypothetical protein
MSNQSFKVKSGLTLTPVDLATLSNPQAGDLACDINDSNKIKRYDAATSAWAEVGSGGVGSLDILFAQDFESASLSSFTQTGLALDTVDPLHGKVSAKLTHDASVNQSFKEIKAVDRKFRGQAIIVRLNVKSSASAGNVTISVYDETNAASLLSSTQLELSNDVDGISNAVSFTIPSTSSSISYTITALPEAGSPVTFIDDIVAELSNVALLETSVDITTPVVTEWQDYSMVIGASVTAPTKGSTSVDKAQWRRVGSDMEIRYDFKQTSAGTVGSGSYLFPIPSGYSIDNAKVPSGSADQAAVGIAKLSATTVPTGATTAQGLVLVSKTYPNRLYITYAQATVENTAEVSSAAYPLNGANTGYSFTAKVPIVGWEATETTTKTIPLTQSGLVQEADGHYQLNNFTYRTASTATGILYFNDGTQVANIGNHITKLSDSVNGDQFIATKTGTYSINATVEIGATAGSVYLVRNNTSAVVANILSAFYEAGSNAVSHLSWTGYLNEGDILRFVRTGGVATFAASDYNVIDIAYQGSLKQVSVSSDQKITIPTSELRFEGASSRGSTATAIVKFDTMAKLRGDAFTVESDSVLGTRITMKKAGKLDVSASLFLTNVSDLISISINQSSLTAAPIATERISTQGAGTSSGSNTASGSVFVKVGDIIRVSATPTAPTANASNNLNLSFQEQDISVSVTNTLPQFSDSDSYVRVATGNGFGSSSTTIRRFASVTSNVGTDILYVDSATAGASFTVQSAGVYNIAYTDVSASGTPPVQISINGSAITISNIPVTSGGMTISAQPYLQSGDIITVGSINPAGITSASSSAQVLISKVGKPNVTGVDVTPFVNVPQPDTQSSFLSSSAAFGNVDITGALTSSAGSGIYSYNSATGIYTFLKSSTVNISACLVASNITQTLAQISLNGTQIALASSTTGGNGWGGTASWTGKVSAGDTLKVRNSNTGVTSFSYVSVTATSTSDQILTAPETFSTDTASLSYASSAAYTLSTLQNAPVGTYITFTYAANTNTTTQTTTRPTQTDADVNANGMLIYTRTYNAASTAAQPTRIAMQIGKGLKGVSTRAYDLNKTESLSIDQFVINATNETGLYQTYNEVTGVLVLDAGYAALTTNTSRVFNGVIKTSGYLVINASKSPFVMGFGIANNSEAAAGVISDKFITPKTLKGGLNASGDAPIYAARAWVNFNGTGTVAIRASGNVSSITDNAVGLYTVNFITAMQDANYSVTASVIHDSSTTYGDSVNISSIAAGSVQVSTWIEGSGAALDDKSIVCVTINR